MSVEPPAEASSAAPTPQSAPPAPLPPDEPAAPADPPRAPSRVPGELLALVVAAVIGPALAFPVAALWRAHAPAVRAVFEPASAGGSFYSAPEGKSFVGVDGWFAFLAMGAAIVSAVAAFLPFRRRAATGAVIGLGAGALGGGYLAAWFGALIGPGGGSAARAAAGLRANAVFDLPLTLRATGVVWLWPAVAVGLFFILMLLFGPLDPVPDESFDDDEHDAGAVPFRAGFAEEPSGADRPGVGAAPEPEHDAAVRGEVREQTAGEE